MSTPRASLFQGSYAETQLPWMQPSPLLAQSSFRQELAVTSSQKKLPFLPPVSPNFMRKPFTPLLTGFPEAKLSDDGIRYPRGDVGAQQ